MARGKHELRCIASPRNVKFPNKELIVCPECKQVATIDTVGTYYEPNYDPKQPLKIPRKTTKSLGRKLHSAIAQAKYAIR